MAPYWWQQEGLFSLEMDVSCLSTKKTAMSLPRRLSPPNHELKHAPSATEKFWSSNAAGPGTGENNWHRLASGETQGSPPLPGLFSWWSAWPGGPVHSTRRTCPGGDRLSRTEQCRQPTFCCCPAPASRSILEPSDPLQTGGGWGNHGTLLPVRAGSLPQRPAGQHRVYTGIWLGWVISANGIWSPTPARFGSEEEQLPIASSEHIYLLERFTSGFWHRYS